MRAYQARETRLAGVRLHQGWSLKLYEITAIRGSFSARSFDEGVALALSSLPTDPHAVGRAGVGFVIAHQGAGVDYIILCWWARENELPMRVFVRESVDGSWRSAHGDESVCVWDLQVIAAERDAYVDTFLAPGVASPRERYLEAEFSA